MSKNQKSNGSFNSISIKQPCSQSWNEMFGNDEVRFCHHCAKNVHNLSAITRKAAKKLIAQSKGNLCVQYIRRPDGRIQTADQKIYKIAGRATRLASSVFSASLSLTTAVLAQTAAPSPEISATSISTAQNEKSAIKSDGGAEAISGIVTDPNGTLIPGVNVTLINKSTNEESKTITNEEGVYRFTNVSLANYQISFEGTTGFASKTVENIEINTNGENKTDVSLDVVGTATGGFVIAISYQNPLTQAAYEEDLETVKRLLQDGADVNAKEKDGETTALHAAVETGNVEIVRELLHAGAKPNARAGAKRTPLMQIDDDASTELVNLLLT